MRPTLRYVLLWLVSISILCLVLRVTLMSINMLTEHISTTVHPAQNSVKTIHRYNVNCSAIYNLDPEETERALGLLKEIVEDKDEDLIHLTSKCDTYLQSRGYRDVCMTSEEENFPIAYSLIVHSNAWQVERMIRALYSPSNIFCIHSDPESSDDFQRAMLGLAQCLPNVFIVSKRESMVYATISLVKATWNCLSDLMESEVQWKYTINLCGQDFPVISNIELVSELTRLNGRHMLETIRVPDRKVERYTYHYETKEADFEYKKTAARTDIKKEPPPHSIEMFAGSTFFILSREFIVFLLSSHIVKDFLAWNEDTYAPEEHFWATLVRLPGVPGEIPRSQPDINEFVAKTRLIKWWEHENIFYPPCTGDHVRGICVYGLREMRWVIKFGHWFAKKFDSKRDPIIIQCLEEHLQERQKKFQLISLSDCN